jgi:Bacterial pre-peptidase C-terminal domain
VKITVAKTSGNLDTFLELYGLNYPSGPRLAYNDGNPAAGGTNSQIDRFQLPSSGTYKIVVSSYAGRSTGAFRLTVSPLERSGLTPTSTPTPRGPAAKPRCGGAGTLPMGVPVVGAVRTPTDKCIYTYSGTAGQTVTITLVATSGDLDTYLELYNPSGARLVYNDNNSAAGGTNSQINRYRLPSSGTYYVVVSSYAGRSTGQYMLTVSPP